MRPSRGYVEAKSNRPGDMPAINPRCLPEDTDRCAIIEVLRFERRPFAALRPLRLEPPGMAEALYGAQARH